MSIFGAAGILLAGAVLAGAEDGLGITKQTVFAPFDPNAPAYSPPPGLEKARSPVQRASSSEMSIAVWRQRPASRVEGRPRANNDAVSTAQEQVQLFRLPRSAGWWQGYRSGIDEP